MLILGRRYGSIEKTSGKSYTQLEYEYALSKNIPVFAVVLNESFVAKKISVLGVSSIIEENDILQLLKENHVLNNEIRKLQMESKKIQFGNYTFDELVSIFLKKEIIESEEAELGYILALNALEFFIEHYKDFCAGIPNEYLQGEESEHIFFEVCPYYLGFGMIQKTSTQADKVFYEITDMGAAFYAELEKQEMVV